MKVWMKVLMISGIFLSLLIVTMRISTQNTIQCYDDKECFLNSLVECKPTTYIMSNAFAGTQTATILREANNGCEVRYTVETNSGQQIKDTTCILSKEYKPKHLYVTDGLCN